MRDELVKILGSTERVDTVKARILYSSDNCWHWQGAVQTRPKQKPSPIIMIKGKKESVARVLFQAWLSSKGFSLELPSRIHRSCGNHLCVNPTHAVVIDASLKPE